jgi:origin recognition complex subunit 1
MPKESQASRIKRAKRLLLGKGVNRDDSDDELGFDNHEWEWIYSTAENVKTGLIIGARFGPQFQCMLGDCVLLKANIPSEAWVGIICEFRENDETAEKEAYFMWFSTEKEIINKQKKRTDFLWVSLSVIGTTGAILTRWQNELYITPSWDYNPLTTINGKANVVSLATYKSLYPSGHIPRSSPDFGKLFVCRRGCNTNTATYTEEFQWEEIYQGEQDLGDLIYRIKSGTKATRKKRARDKEEDAVDVSKNPSFVTGWKS